MGDGAPGKKSPSPKGKEKVPSPSSGPEPPSSDTDGGSRSWARVVQGGLRRPVWSSPKISEGEMEELQGYFSAILDLPAEEVADTRRQWEGRSLLVRSLGRKVSAEALKREARGKLRLPADPETFPLAEDHLILRFADEEVCARALKEGPWIVSGQLLAVEPWRPRFNPSRRPVSKALVWLRLPFLPAEFWSTASILSIAARAGRPVEIDSFTDNLSKMGFARVKVEIDALWPLTPGVLVRDEGEPFWQQFQFESIPSVCFLCGLVGHFDANCPHRETEARKKGVRPRLGPWVVASKTWQPSPAPQSGTSGSRFGSSPGTSPGSSVPGSNSTVRSPPVSSPSPQAVTGDAEGWRKPSKVARRSSQGKSNKGDDVNAGLQPGPLALIPARMDYLSASPEVAERAMPDPDALALKRPRSPSPEDPADARLLVVVPSKETRPASDDRQSALRSTALGSRPRSGQVSTHQPCMSSPVEGGVGGEEEKGTEAEGLVLVPVEIAEAWRGMERVIRKKGTQGKTLGSECGSGDGLEGPVESRVACGKSESKAVVGGKRGGKKSGDLGKPKGGRGLAIGPTWCCGSGQDLGVSGGGGDVGEGTTGGNEGAQQAPPLVGSEGLFLGSGTLQGEVADRGSGRFFRGGRRTPTRSRGGGRLGGVPSVLGEGGSRDRSRSPVGVWRVLSGGEGSSGGSRKGGDAVYPPLPHEETLAHIRSALQGEKGGKGEGERGGGLGQSSGGSDQS